MPQLVIRARRAHNLGHRTIAGGDVYGRIDFGSEADAKHFTNNFRWSAFSLEPTAEVEPQPAIAAAEQLAVEPTAPAAPAAEPAPKGKRRA